MFNYHQDLWQLFMYPSHIFVIIYHFSSNFLPVVVVLISSKSYHSSAKHSPCHCCDVLASVAIFVGVVIQGLRQHQQLGFINSCKFTESGMVGSDPIRYVTSIYLARRSLCEIINSTLGMLIHRWIGALYFAPALNSRVNTER